MGISALYQAAALELNGPGGRLVTVEGSDSLVALARQGFRELGLSNATCVTGCFQQVIPRLLQDAGPIDFAFVDGHHEEQPTLRYFEWISAHLAPGALLVFDDISWSEGMQRAWRVLCRDSRLCLAVDTGILGLCVAGGERGAVQEFRVVP
jgi:predicted O-methyltransferase YrrM